MIRLTRQGYLLLTAVNIALTVLTIKTIPHGDTVTLPAISFFIQMALVVHRSFDLSPKMSNLLLYTLAGFLFIFPVIIGFFIAAVIPSAPHSESWRKELKETST